MAVTRADVSASGRLAAGRILSISGVSVVIGAVASARVVIAQALGWQPAPVIAVAVTSIGDRLLR
jgi:hypothetical protein